MATTFTENLTRRTETLRNAQYQLTDDEALVYALTLIVDADPTFQPAEETVQTRLLELLKELPLAKSAQEKVIAVNLIK